MRPVAAALVVLALAIPAWAGPPGADDIGPSPLEWAPLPEPLARVLEAKSNGYARRALGFSVKESVREARYSNEEARREKVEVYDYLLVREGAGPEGFRAFRTRPGETKEERVDLPFPDALLWTQVFQPGIRSTLRFLVGDWHTTPYKLAIPVSWVTSAPVFGQRRITEWTGTVEVEYRTGNLVRVVARPSLQDERLKTELARYLTAFRFIGIAFAPPPIGVELSVEFDFEHDGFTYPTRAELLTFQLVHEDQRRTVSRQVITYDEYRFFGTEVKDEIPPLTWNAPERLPVPAPQPERRAEPPE
ncbi:MAG: hypothetical protein H6Q01_356 [Acidobacteria bacterium]|nr:hypothetical protein [Acidobacteriota bacterium]